MRIYFDTEFSSLWDPQLLSIGFAADDGSTFYVELHHDPARHSKFTAEVVAPLMFGRGVSREAGRGMIRNYLYALQAGPAADELVTDFIGDFWLLRDLVPNILEYGTPRCARNADYTAQLAIMGKPAHNALWDAMALRMLSPPLQVEG